MHTRYLDDIKKNKLDFVVRRYPKYFFGIFLLVGILLAISIISIMEINISFYIEILCIGFVLVVGFLAFYISRKLQLITISAEFQSMLFSNSVKSITDFYMIVNSEGKVVYKDDRDSRIKGELGGLINSDNIIDKESAHQLKLGGYKIIIRPLIRPSNYLLIAVIAEDDDRYYYELLDTIGIPAYKIEFGRMTKSNGAYKKRFPSGRIIDNLFENHSIARNGTSYGILMPLQLRQVLDVIPIGCAFFEKGLQVIDANKIFFELTEAKYNINDRLNKKISIDSDLSTELEFKNGNCIRAYIGKFRDIFIGFFIDINETKSLKEKLQRSQKIESLGQLSGGIAHDFNNILTAIHGFSEVLLSDMDINNDYYYDIEQIRSSAEMGRKLVKKILAFARNQTLKVETIDVNEVIIGLKQIIERLIPENIKLSFNLAPNPKFVKADRVELEQTIINLVVNSRDAIDSSGEISIKTENSVIAKKELVLKGSQNEELIKNGEYIKITVSDTGKGIDKKTLPKIFDPFFSTKDVNKGTGLGLSTAYGIIKQVGGYIDVKSKIGKGTKFTLFIPVSYEAVKKDETVSQQHKAVKMDKKILIVEDDKMVKQFLIKALEKNNFNFVDSHSPSSAIDIFKNDSISLVISDVIMPEMSGPEMVSLMREIKSDLKVIFISGYTRDKLKLKDDDNNSYFLEKPFKMQDLTSLINDALK